jgi:HPt (histidine-containing phosphotransfer) domain-containing protein
MPDPLDPAAIDELLAMAGGDPALLGELLADFATDADQYAAELDAAVAAGDDDGLVRPAHSLKSNALNVGASYLAELCRSLEAEARSGTVPRAAQRVTEIQAELTAVREAVRRVAESHGA